MFTGRHAEPVVFLLTVRHFVSLPCGPDLRERNHQSKNAAQQLLKETYETPSESVVRSSPRRCRSPWHIRISSSWDLRRHDTGPAHQSERFCAFPLD